MEENIRSRDEGIRQLLELAISCGRSWQSEQTGYVHFCYHSMDENLHHTIPLVENVMFALALFRSKTSDNILEAKSIIDKILYYQNHSSDISIGNFPIYLHDYPICKDYFLGTYLLAPFFYIYKDFHTVLGKDLKSKLEKSLLILLDYCLKIYQEKNPPYHIAIRISSSVLAIGVLFQRIDLQNQGQKMMEDLQTRNNQSAWANPSSIADILISLQMVYPSIVNSPWTSFWNYLSNTWHRPTCTYIGPGFKEFQKDEEPQPSLYDLYMGYFSGSFSYRAFSDHPFQLQAALIQQTDDRVPSMTYPITLQGQTDSLPWAVFQQEKFAYSLIQREETNPANKGFIPVKLIWGDRNRVHTFVSQSGNILKMDYEVYPDGFDLVFHLDKPTEAEDREKSREICFYLDALEGTEIKINHKLATIFRIEETVNITTPKLSVNISFEIEGDGQFMGHLMLGNRPSQEDLKGKNRFVAFDWQIFLRSIKRSDPCQIKAKIRIL